RERSAFGGSAHDRHRDPADQLVLGRGYLSSHVAGRALRRARGASPAVLGRHLFARARWRDWHRHAFRRWRVELVWTSRNHRPSRSAYFSRTWSPSRTSVRAPLYWSYTFSIAATSSK